MIIATTDIPCCDEIHKVGITENGRFVLLNHDLRSERSCILIGGIRHNCISFIDSLKNFKNNETYSNGKFSFIKLADNNSNPETVCVSLAEPFKKILEKYISRRSRRPSNISSLVTELDFKSRLHCISALVYLLLPRFLDLRIDGKEIFIHPEYSEEKITCQPIVRVSEFSDDKTDHWSLQLFLNNSWFRRVYLPGKLVYKNNYLIVDIDDKYVHFINHHETNKMNEIFYIGKVELKNTESRDFWPNIPMKISVSDAANQLKNIIERELDGKEKCPAFLKRTYKA